MQTSLVSANVQFPEKIIWTFWSLLLTKKIFLQKNKIAVRLNFPLHKWLKWQKTPGSNHNRYANLSHHKFRGYTFVALRKMLFSITFMSILPMSFFWLHNIINATTRREATFMSRGFRKLKLPTSLKPLICNMHEKDGFPYYIANNTTIIYKYNA